MRILFDLEKRKKTLAERGLDFEDAAIVFQGVTVEIPDERKDYGEVRIICFGLLKGRIVVMVKNGTSPYLAIDSANCNSPTHIPIRSIICPFGWPVAITGNIIKRVASSFFIFGIFRYIRLEGEGI